MVIFVSGNPNQNPEVCDLDTTLSNTLGVNFGSYSIREYCCEGTRGFLALGSRISSLEIVHTVLLFFSTCRSNSNTLARAPEQTQHKVSKLHP